MHTHLLVLVLEEKQHHIGFAVSSTHASAEVQPCQKSHECLMKVDAIKSEISFPHASSRQREKPSIPNPAVPPFLTPIFFS